MANVSGERDIQRAKDLRKSLKGVRSPLAKTTIEATADRLENRGANKIAKLARRRRKKAPDAAVGR